jgi:hypothetical protein
MKASDMWCVLWALEHQKLRQMMKYEEHTEEEYAIIENIRDYLRELMSDHGLDFEMVS